jgi:hypothetical protein
MLSFFFLGVGWDWVHLVRRPLIDLPYQPRMIADVDVEQSVEWELARETEVLGEKLRHKSHRPDLGMNPDRRSGKPETNRLRYGATFDVILTKSVNEVEWRGGGLSRYGFAQYNKFFYSVL